MIMKDLKESGLKVTKVLHDKDASTFRQVVQVFEDADEQLCSSKCFRKLDTLFTHRRLIVGSSTAHRRLFIDSKSTSFQYCLQQLTYFSSWLQKFQEKDRKAGQEAQGTERSWRK